MKTIDIQIKTNGGGQLVACYGNYSLFAFEYRKEKGCWYFWPRSPYIPAVIPGREFPMEFFRDACRAKHFIKAFPDAMADDIVITSGRSYIR